MVDSELKQQTVDSSPSASDPSGDPKRACLDKAMQLLAVRPHFRSQLERKLATRGHSSGDVESVLTELESSGLIDDRDCALQFATTAVERKGHGPRRVRAELQQHSVSSRWIDEALAVYFPEREAEFADRVAARWSAKGLSKPDALARHLDRRGFSPATIRQQIDRLRQQVSRDRS